MNRNEYAPVADHIAKDPQFVIKENTITFNLTGGEKLENIIPTGISEREVSPNQTKLVLTYLTLDHQTHELPIEQVPSLRVSVGLPNTPLAGKLLVQGTYFTPRDGGQMEAHPRNFSVIGVSFGIQEKHADYGEIRPDYYFEAYDQQYLTNGQALESSLRRFPLWRLGIYGQVLGQVPNYMQKQ